MCTQLPKLCRPGMLALFADRVEDIPRMDAPLEGRPVVIPLAGL